MLTCRRPTFGFGIANDTIVASWAIACQPQQRVISLQPPGMDYHSAILGWKILVQSEAKD
jgi:hypothetical protein